MDQAVYEPITQKIFGVRGQWIFKFNSVTGALEGSLRFGTSIAGTSTIAAISGKLYIGVSWSPVVDYTASPVYPNEDIYIVDAASFTASGKLGVASHLSPGTDTAPFGWRTMVAAGSNLIGFYSDNAGTSYFNVDPTNTPGFTHTAAQGVTDIAWDSANGVFWSVTSFDPDIWCYNPVFASFQTCFDTNGNLNTICGICYNSSNNRVYAVDGSPSFYNFNATLAVPGFSNFHVNTLGTGRINCNAFRIKSVNGLVSNPLNGKVLIPAWADDSVIVITPNAGNPLLDTVSVKTGFTAPFDIVSTPTKNWAVQTGVTGLKEIV